MVVNKITFTLHWNYIYIYIYALSVSICHWDCRAEIPHNCAGALLSYIRLQLCIAVPSLNASSLLSLKERCSNWPVSSFCLALHEITQCISMGGWGYYMRMKIFLFPCLHQQNASDSRENEKVQLFSEGNIKLLYGRHRMFQLGLDVTRIVMKCSTSLMCLRILLHEGHSGHMASSNCQETFADFAWEVSV